MKELREKNGLETPNEARHVKELQKVLKLMNRPTMQGSRRKGWSGRKKVYRKPLVEWGMINHE